MKPPVSILIPAYNAEKWIAETLESALNQSWPNKEIIVVDDGSKDDTLAIAKAFQSRGVAVIHQENRGASAARNRALLESRGDFIQYLDADDLLSENKIETQLGHLSNFNGYVASCEWGRFYKSISDVQFVPEDVWKDMNPVDWLVTAWEKGPMLQPAIWLIPREVIVSAGPWNEELSLIDDFEYFARILLASRGVKFCPSAKVYYRSGHGQTLSGSNSSKAWKSLFLSLDLGTQNLVSRENSLRVRRVCATLFQRFIYEVYPDEPGLIRSAIAKVSEYGGSDAKPSGGPLFQLLSFLIGWKAARKLQKLVNRFGYKKASIGWRLERCIKKLNYNYVAHQNRITRGSDRS